MSRRMNLTIDLDDNEVFDKQIVELIQAKVREVCRNSQVQLITDTAQKELERLIDKNESAESRLYHIGIRDLVQSQIRTLVAREISKMNIENVIKQEIDNVMEHIVAKCATRVSLECQNVLSKTITKEVEAKITSILVPIEPAAEHAIPSTASSDNH